MRPLVTFHDLLVDELLYETFYSNLDMIMLAMKGRFNKNAIQEIS